ncbi:MULTISPECIES: ACT domain-containing protein [unclassified Tessaracoccus]|uniref:ACT domain-containing protein n=1 Tax=unclassified Tessaracoccus TaxID=2635419 RepID=UPI001600DBD8|nr:MULTISPECIES: ACT domain-containing protein [unclassified Tessaracoccus]MBB1511441.1 ACT domain-containing protein [Tessaracoccus sp. MC1627]MBB1514856.1 ACT domain-containing protein [Tessaracoccus sp. MC1679]
MSGETELTTLLATMSPVVCPGAFVFVVGPGPVEAEVLASVVESEGLSMVLRKEDADRLGLDYDYVAGWITLTVQSSLAAVGLTAAVSTALAEASISCNVVAGYHHDHLLVPADRLDDALAALRRLAGNARV